MLDMRFGGRNSRATPGSSENLVKQKWHVIQKHQKKEQHGNEAHEIHRSEDALFSAQRDEEDLKLLELFRT